MLARHSNPFPGTTLNSILQEKNPMAGKCCCAICNRSVNGISAPEQQMFKYGKLSFSAWCQMQYPSIHGGLVVLTQGMKLDGGSSKLSLTTPPPQCSSHPPRKEWNTSRQLEKTQRKQLKRVQGATPFYLPSSIQTTQQILCYSLEYTDELRHKLCPQRPYNLMKMEKIF